MDTQNSVEAFPELTTTEISNIWAAYMKNSMEIRLIEYFIEITEDSEIRQLVTKMLDHSKRSINDVRDILKKENICEPKGFTDQDIRLDAQKLFSDTFVCYFCYDLILFSIHTFSSALVDCTRKDVRNYFQHNLDFYINIQNEIIEIMLAKGIYLKPPVAVIDNTVDMVDEMNYFIQLFGNSRPINVSEIANIARILHRAQFSKMIFVAFSKIASSKEMKLHFAKGIDEIQEVINSLQEVLDKENISISTSSDCQIFDVEVSPFSDKLMLFFVNMCLGLYCFTIISQAMTSSFRSDIVMKVTKIMKRMKRYYGEGLKLMTNEGWLERPPQSINKL